MLTSREQSLVFVYVTVGGTENPQGELFVLRDDDRRAELLDRKQLGGCRYDVSGSGPGPGDLSDFLNDAWDFITEFPESKFKNRAINNISSFLFSENNETEKDGALKILQILMEKYPDNYSLIRFYSRYGLENKSHLNHSLNAIEKYYDQKKYTQALPYLEKATVVQPKYSKAHNVMGLTLKGLRKFAEAESAFHKAISSEKKRTSKGSYYYNLGYLFIC